MGHMVPQGSPRIRQGVQGDSGVLEATPEADWDVPRVLRVRPGGTRGGRVYPGVPWGISQGYPRGTPEVPPLVPWGQGS